ncbi:MAG: polyphosphate kinase 2, partial [Cutibacterium granulosum]|nr:polyphosphate kinase 2 [Cutibacterium granulosum]
MTESLPDPILTGSQHSLREFIDQVHDAGYVVRSDTHGDDPELIAPDGSAVETWHEDYPYPELMDRMEYEEQKRLLQIELLKFQYSIEDSGDKHLIIFEGRDAAGKGGCIKRFT